MYILISLCLWDLVLSGKVSFYSVVFNWDQFCPPEDIWQCLRTIFVVTAGGGCCWRLVGRDQCCCWTFYSALDSPHNKVIWPQISIVPILRYPDLRVTFLLCNCFFLYVLYIMHDIWINSYGNGEGESPIIPYDWEWNTIKKSHIHEYIRTKQTKVTGRK